MNWVMLIMTVFMIYLIIKILMESKRNGMNRKMLNVLDTFSYDPEGNEFYTKADEFLANEKNVEFLNKVRVLRLWADAYHEKKDEFKKDLETIDLDALVIGDGKGKNGNQIEMNEDSFFYLYLAIPNRLHSDGDEEDLKLHYEKLAHIQDLMANRLVKVISDANRKYFAHEGDCGKAFYTSVLDGDYGQYAYSKELIGIYKNVVTCMISRIALDENDQKAFEEQVPELRSFAKSNLGKRFAKELGIDIPAEEDDEPLETDEPIESDEPAKQIETKAETPVDETEEPLQANSNEAGAAESELKEQEESTENKAE